MLIGFDFMNGISLYGLKVAIKQLKQCVSTEYVTKVWKLGKIFLSSILYMVDSCVFLKYCTVSASHIFLAPGRSKYLKEKQVYFPPTVSQFSQSHI